MSLLRVRFALKRLFSRPYQKQLQTIVQSPLKFYEALALKILPGLHTTPIPIRLRDGKVFIAWEFWSLFLFDEIFMQRCYDAPQFAKRNDIRSIVDVGANIGTFTLRAKQLWPDAHIVAIEPHPENFARLQELIRVNNLQNVTPLNMGLSDARGSFPLYLSPRNIGGHSMLKKSDHSIEIRTERLETILPMLGQDGRCDLVKIDCEGAEVGILQSISPELGLRIGQMIIEPEYELYSEAQLSQMIGRAGFSLEKFEKLVVATRARVPELHGVS